MRKAGLILKAGWSDKRKKVYWRDLSGEFHRRAFYTRLFELSHKDPYMCKADEDEPFSVCGAAPCTYARVCKANMEIAG
jgi:hypothetical protein